MGSGQGPNKPGDIQNMGHGKLLILVFSVTMFPSEAELSEFIQLKFSAEALPRHWCSVSLCI